MTFSHAPPRKPVLARFFVWTFFGLAAIGGSDFVSAQTAGAGAAVSSQTRQDMQLRQQLKETDPMGGGGGVQEETVAARPLSPDMGDVQIMTKKDEKPWFFLTVDTQAFYNSNVLYATSVDSTFGG